VEVLDERCFARCKSLNDVIFEDDSLLKRIEKEAFIETVVKSIRIPSNTQVEDEIGAEVIIY
jgi:hypothetical protein